MFFPFKIIIPLTRVRLHHATKHAQRPAKWVISPANSAPSLPIHSLQPTPTFTRLHRKALVLSLATDLSSSTLRIRRASPVPTSQNLVQSPSIVMVPVEETEEIAEMEEMELHPPPRLPPQVLFRSRVLVSLAYLWYQCYHYSWLPDWHSSSDGRFRIHGIGIGLCWRWASNDDCVS